ncbi:MAG: hypothetical protein K2Q01_01550 [Rickettsiales bacterium]|nr:hypothetical protein [Rickettsiales bacterium]
MSKKWAYAVAVLFLLALRIGAVDTDAAQTLWTWGFEKTARVLASLRENPAFNEFAGSWAMPVFVCGVLIYWFTHEDESGIPMQFLLLPIFYIPLSILGAILVNAEFRLTYLWVHPLIILPFGYLYVSLWTILIWLLEKLRLVE